MEGDELTHEERPLAERPITRLTLLERGGAAALGLGFGGALIRASGALAASPAGWDAILAKAKGQTVNWFMWSGSTTINSFVDKLVGDEAKKFGVKVKRVPLTDTVQAVQKVLGEKQAGRKTNGSVDLIWVNGENFRTGKQAKLWFGGYTQKLGNTKLVDWNSPSIAFDFGVKVDGLEVPWGRAQFAFFYNSNDVKQVPQTMGELIAWIKANPGRFTYPAPPDFTGSVFVRHVLYFVNGGFKDLLGPFDKAKFDAAAPKLWKTLNDLKPSLWRQGSTYPASIAELDSLYSNGEVSLDMTYGPGGVGGQVDKGIFPDTTRELVFTNGTIGNTNFTAIPFNSPHKEGAMVVQNILISPKFQFLMAQPKLFGQFAAINVQTAGAAWVKKFDSIPTPPSVLPAKALTRNSNPELQAGWVTAVEKGWKENVLQA